MLASAQKRREFAALCLAEFDSIAYIHLCLLGVRGTDEQLNRMSEVSRSARTFTSKQGQYLAFIYAYTRLHRRPPAECPATITTASVATINHTSIGGTRA